MRGWVLPIATLGLGLVLGVGIGMSLRPAAPASPEGRESVGGAAAPIAPSRTRLPPEEIPPAVISSARTESEESEEPEEPGVEPAVQDEGPPLADLLRSAFRGAFTVAPEKLAHDVREVLARLAKEHGVVGGAAWILADGSAGAVALRAILEGAGLTLDEAQIEALMALANRSAEGFRTASDTDRPETERMALRRAAELVVENGLAELLHSVQRDALTEALDGRSVAETLPGGEERDTMSSTGIDRARASKMVLENYRRRLGLEGEPHPGMLQAIANHVTRVEGVNRDLEARWGRGFVEAIASGPTPHTEAARRAREEPDYARRELEARADLWRLQAALEVEMAPYLDAPTRALLKKRRPTALRFLLADPASEDGD